MTTNCPKEKKINLLGRKLIIAVTCSVILTWEAFFLEKTIQTTNQPFFPTAAQTS